MSERNRRMYKIVSNGYPFDTHVFDPEGKEVKGITKVTWSVDCMNMARMTLEFANVELDVEGEYECMDTNRTAIAQFVNQNSTEENSRLERNLL